MESLEKSLTPDESFTVSFCDKYCIMYDTGCRHAVQGCSEDIFNGHLISKWKHRTTGFEYDGMPQFDSIDEFRMYAEDVEILEIICPNNGIKCQKAYHQDITNKLSHCTIPGRQVSADAHILKL